MKEQFVKTESLNVLLLKQTRAEAETTFKEQIGYKLDKRLQGSRGGSWLGARVLAEQSLEAEFATPNPT